jgi:hypothetical protein
MRLTGRLPGSQAPGRSRVTQGSVTAHVEVQAEKAHP